MGRLSSIGASLLSIKPIICLKEGEIFNEGLKRGRKKALGAVIEKTISHFCEHGRNIDEYEFVVGYGYDREEAEAFRDQLVDSIKTVLNFEIPIPELEQIGATIAVHTGPYPLGVGLVKKA